MSGVYRSRLRMRRPALGGHELTFVKPPPGWEEDPDAFDVEVPGMLQCHLCWVIVTDFELREGFYPRPCMGAVRAILPGPAHGDVLQLFDPGPGEELVVQAADSPTVRRTKRARAAIAAGRHPLTGGELLEGDETCKTCHQSYPVTLRSGRRYWKCGLVGDTRGPGTDLVLSWPACRLWKGAS